MKRKGLIIGGIVILLAAAAGALFFFRQSQAKQAAEGKQQETAPARTEISLSATLQATAIVEVSVPVEGKIEAFHAEVGDEVFEGQLLAQILSQLLQTA
jgi:multidrug efflux pump subunit AcrA (membrane-fusion protein)